MAKLATFPSISLKPFFAKFVRQIINSLKVSLPFLLAKFSQNTQPNSCVNLCMLTANIRQSKQGKHNAIQPLEKLPLSANIKSSGGSFYVPL